LGVKKNEKIIAKKMYNQTTLSPNMETSTLYEEFGEIVFSCKKRYDDLDDDLKILVTPLMSNPLIYVPMDRMIDLFQCRVLYPELPEGEKFISFSELSNGSMRKILSQKFNLVFAQKGDVLLVRGESNDGVIFRTQYYKPQKKLFSFLDKTKTEPEQPLPTNETLVAVFSRTGHMRIQLPAGYLV